MGGNCTCKKSVNVKEKYSENPQTNQALPEAIRNSFLANETSRRPSNIPPSSKYQTERKNSKYSSLNMHSLSSNQHMIDVENNFGELQRRMKKIKIIKDKVK